MTTPSVNLTPCSDEASLFHGRWKLRTAFRVHDTTFADKRVIPTPPKEAAAYMLGLRPSGSIVYEPNGQMTAILRVDPSIIPVSFENTFKGVSAGQGFVGMLLYLTKVVVFSWLFALKSGFYSGIGKLVASLSNGTCFYSGAYTHERNVVSHSIRFANLHKAGEVVRRQFAFYDDGATLLLTTEDDNNGLGRLLLIWDRERP